MKLLTLALPLLVLTAACGGGDGEKATGGVSKATYLGQAEAICAQANADSKALKTPQAVSQLAPYVAGLVAIADTATAKIKALTPPPADRADLTKKVLEPLESQLQEGHAYADKVAAASAKNDEAALTQLTLNPPKGAAADLEWMRKYGFKECVDAAEVG